MQEFYNPQAMQQVGQLPLAMLWDGMDYLKQAQGRDQMSLEAMMAENQRKAAMHEADLKQKGATLESTMLGNSEKQLALEKQRRLQPKQIDNELTQLGIAATDLEWKQAEQKIMEGVRNNNPEALKLYEQLPAIREKRRADSEARWKEQEATRRATSVATIGADSKRDIQTMRDQQAKDLASIKAAAQGGKQSLNQLAAQYISQAQQSQDPTVREYYMNLANTVAMVGAQMTPAGQAPVLDPTKLPQGTPLREPAAPTMPERPASGAQAPQTQYEVGKTYTGKTGTYRFKGGDVKNPANWEKVQ